MHLYTHFMLILENFVPRYCPNICFFSKSQEHDYQPTLERSQGRKQINCWFTKKINLGKPSQERSGNIFVIYQYRGTLPPPFRRIGNFCFFSLAIFFLFLKLQNDILRTMKRILYDTANPTMVNRAARSKGRREKGLCMNIWISQQHNKVYCSPIQLNLILFPKILNK